MENVLNYSSIAIKKLNSMLLDKRFVKVLAVDSSGILIQNKKGSQKIDRFGRVHNYE